MINAVTRLAAAILALVPLSAAAEPIQLKLAFFGSDQIETYLYGIKPFVDAVNAEGKGLLAIEVYSNGVLGKALAEQPGLVLDRVADIAFVIPGQTPYRFPDNELLEQPGLFRDTREGTLVYTRLIATGALRGYQDFVVIGAFTPDPSFIHSRKPIESLAALKGQKIRANNPIEAEALQRLGAIPTVLEVPKVADAIRKGAIDGAAASPSGLFQFGISQVATHHFLLRVGTAPMFLAMNRQKFDSLPEAAKALVRKYSGEQAAATWIGSLGIEESRMLDKLKSDYGRKIVEPSAADFAAAQRVYRSMIDAWAAERASNRQLLTTVENELATLPSTR
jgi:TRAP-type C4-dicarboxylate transport system substrate-binding protein